MLRKQSLNYSVLKSRYNIFDDQSNNTQKMKMRCLVLFYFWYKGTYLEGHESIVVVLESF